ncbi:nucleoside 2-deoxyribosyltransferase [Pedobacter montanisoli]|uniref:Nucleoside 2-deoxyribosyltransferase n=1 Tax=Pedobacter montanisoli TaxID=2923277 RepID=A0ABT0A012_9SPHI|nr:nucleoside 2-deoxyribosyltransferase [Pedobacter montanisoli]MCJ0743910.1 nucleoside 2-deoxyribosyltransferase [Pedobacter montanisoli]
MRAYISVSFSKRKSMDAEITTIVHTLNKFDIASIVFVDQYQFYPHQEQQMMLQAMSDINGCDLLIAETSDKGIGIGIEVGYAKAKGKPIIYMRKADAEHSTTVSGIADFRIIYTDTGDLEKQLAQTVNMLKA